MRPVGAPSCLEATASELANRAGVSIATVNDERRRAVRWVWALAATISGAALAACASAPEPPERLVYLALGASDAAGVGADPITQGYVFQIANELDERIDVVLLANLAVPGANTEQLDEALELFLETDVEPGLVTVWTGANDLIRGEDADDFEEELEEIFARLRDRTDGVIAAANIPDLTELPRFRDEPDDDATQERVEEFNEAIAAQAEDYDVLLVDLYAEGGEDDLVSDEDGFHPNNEGHRQIADKFLVVILPGLGLAPTV
jgi:lysophospholipase L1-like esterase